MQDMEDAQKPFSCTVEGCTMRFTNEDHLLVHKRKHDMVLNLGSSQKTNVFMADQTPTPTRFIRNCEEVGLFQDLQNVNPFEETFRKAVEASREGGSHLEVDSLHVPTTADDTLHTPIVFPTEEHHSITNHTTSTGTVETESGEKSQSGGELEPLQTSNILHPESSITEVSERTSDLDANIEISELDNSEALAKEDADKSPQIPSRASSADSGCKITLPTAPAQEAIQVVVQLPDGRLLQLPGFTLESVQSTQFPVQTTTLPQSTSTSSSTSNTVIINTQFVQPAATLTQVPAGGQSSIVPTRSSGITVSTDTVNTPQARLSAAKMKLKQRIQFNSKKKEILPSDIENSQSSLRKGPGVRVIRAPSSESSDNPSSPKTKKIHNFSTEVDEQKLKFRERNRAAAMRCREKRKHWINDLERRADETQKLNQQLTSEVARLRNEVTQLKTLLLAHKDCSVTKAIQQGVGITITKQANTGKTSPVTQLQVQPSAVPIPRLPVSIPGSVNICTSPEDPHPKVVLLSKPAGLKRRRPAALAAGLTIVENGTLHSNDPPIEQQNTAQVVTVTQPMSITPAVPDSSQISCSNQQENEKSCIITDSVSSQPTCLIVAAQTLIPAGIPTQGIAIKSGSLTSTSYLVPTKLCLPNDSALPQVIKLNSNIQKSSSNESIKPSSVTHANGDSMDSGHGSDIEILAEIPGKPEVKS